MVAPGDLLQSRYRVLGSLGKGGFGEVFEVEEQGVSKVLKVLNLSPFPASQHSKVIALFEREVEILSQIRHPGVPQLDRDGHFVIPQPQQLPLHCLVMEKIPGVNLQQWLQEGGVLTQPQAIGWLKQLILILMHLHQQQFFHRDVKPTNIMLRPDGQLVLIDFGAVREITLTYLARQKQQVTGTAIISAGYTPPEQIEGQSVLQSDFFALGRTFVYLFTGEAPIDLPKDSQTGQILWCDRVRGGVQLSPQLIALINQLMAPFPGQRPQTGDAIIQAIQRLESASLTSLSLYKEMGDAPDPFSFYGRIDELATLKQWILGDVEQQGMPPCRLIAVLGMGGIGKTSLVVKLAEQLQDQFEFVIWRSLLNAPPLTEILADWIQFLSKQQEVQVPGNLDRCLSRLRDYLQTYRCLLILDNVETILAGGVLTGQYRTGYEDYGQLFEQIGKTAHQSCLVITSREKPQEVARLEGKMRPVRSLPLQGLGILEGRQISVEVGDIVGSDSEWQALVEFYQGNPLGLEMATKFIGEFCAGRIDRFFGSGQLVFHDLQDLLGLHFDRLSEFEQEIVYWLAIHREPVSLSQLSHDLLFPDHKSQTTSTLQSLKRRWILSSSNFDSGAFTLQPVLLEYMTHQIIRQVFQEILTGQINLLHRFALIQAQSRDYIREVQVRVILNPLTVQLREHLRTEAMIRQHLDALLQSIRDKPELGLGYAAGNLLNLYQTFRLDLTGYNFSSLSIRQAYLQESILHQVNFQNADLESSRFANRLGLGLSVAFSPEG